MVRSTAQGTLFALIYTLLIILLICTFCIGTADVSILFCGRPKNSLFSAPRTHQQTCLISLFSLRRTIWLKMGSQRHLWPTGSN